ncbi:MAG: amidohydrolase family protein [Steroidobacteraceae bacterium]
MRCAILILSILLPVAVAGAHAAKNTFAIRDVRVFDGNATLAHANVVVRAGRIEAVAAGAVIPAGMRTLDGRGRTLLPGLIDSHAHVFPGARADALRFGVTTVLDMFDVSREFKSWRAQRGSLAQTDLADIWAAGLGVTVKGGAPLQSLPPGMTLPTLDGVADARRFVDARVAEGSDYIKLFIENLSEYGGGKTLPTLSPAEVCAVISAAHADHRMAIVHAQAEWAAREAIECGADGLAHMIPDRPLGSSFIALARRHHVFVETTAAVWAGASGVGLADSLALDPRVAPYLSASQRSTLLATDKRTVPSFFPTVIANIRALHAAAIPILAGTDAPNPATAFGVSLHEELQILVRAGFTPAEALHAATELPAEIFHLGRRGRVAPGYRADLLLVSGDPTRRISDTLAIQRIWMNGFEVRRRVGDHHAARPSVAGRPPAHPFAATARMCTAARRSLPI